MTNFDVYLMVDWSANSKPKLGADSIWYCMVEGAGGDTVLANCSTREKAVTQIADLLAENTRRGLFTLAGFDFPYGYPSGFADALGFKLEHGPVWQQVWDLLSRLIKDAEDNSNNRFQVAAALNKQVSDAGYRFWGCPESEESPTLLRRRPYDHAKASLHDKRITERLAPTAQSAFKLYGPGTVGSQALLGIPCLARLRCDSRLARASRVWPFETGLEKPPGREKRNWSILHAEIFPGIIRPAPQEGETRDAAQVRTLAHHFARLDKEGNLSILFEGPSQLDPEERRVVESEERWILGVQE